MTTEKLKNTIKLAEGIEALETFQNAFREPYVKGLFAYKAGAVEPIRLNVESDSELYEIINDYLKRRLAEMKKQFEEM